MNQGEYRAVVFAGGGNRCVWQAGFWEEVAPVLPLRPAVLAAVSAGAFMAAMLLAGRTERAMNWVWRELQTNHRNFYPERLLKGQRPFPHPEIFGRNISENLDEDALAAMRQGPELRVLLARPPRWCGPRLAVWVGFAAYVLEKHTKAPLHPTWAMRVGFRPEVVTAQACRDAGELKELILATSCTPPILPVMHRAGRPVLDGGLVDNVPLVALKPEERPALVLLTRRYPAERLRGHPGLTYIQPTQPSPAGKWDYTHPDAMRATYDLGRADGRRFLAHGAEALQV
ncbi:MAG: patatin-like phospholipase family protein [Pseudomonadota bacterium]